MPYSQRDEETFILESCKDATRPRFLDIGAFDPKAMSNTRALYELGWGGVMIEPSPKCVRELVIEYGPVAAGNVEVVAAAVGLEAGLMPIRISDDAVSSSEAGNIQAWSDRGGYLGWLTVPVLTMPEIINRWGAFDMVSIDTEGTSVDLFKQLIATEMFPRCIVVEHDNRIVEASMAAHKRGYKVLYMSEENLVFSL